MRPVLRHESRRFSSAELGLLLTAPPTYTLLPRCQQHACSQMSAPDDAALLLKSRAVLITRSTCLSSETLAQRLSSTMKTGLGQALSCSIELCLHTAGAACLCIPAHLLWREAVCSRYAGFHQHCNRHDHDDSGQGIQCRDSGRYAQCH